MDYDPLNTEYWPYAPAVEGPIIKVEPRIELDQAQVRAELERIMGRPPDHQTIMADLSTMVCDYRLTQSQDTYEVRWSDKKMRFYIAKNDEVVGHCDTREAADEWLMSKRDEHITLRFRIDAQGNIEHEVL